MAVKIKRIRQWMWAPMLAAGLVAAAGLAIAQEYRAGHPDTYVVQKGDTLSKIAKEMYLAAYRSSVELAKEKGAFPLFDAKKYLAEGTTASRLPESIKGNSFSNGYCYGSKHGSLLRICFLLCKWRGNRRFSFCNREWQL